ncbi:MAG TPA: CPBP family intramembrane glutamic endopeptidase [Gemmatimonadales bacterium]|nr:CPBP family intramembrane glutamic endopeptidase [Gemmatimonadales bacterium]
MNAALNRVIPIIWTAIIIIVVPLQAVVTRRLLASMHPTPAQAYASTARGLLALGVITLVVDLLGPRVGIRALAARIPAGSFLAWSGVTLAACVAVSLALLLYRRATHQAMDPLVVAMLPRTANERLAFVGISLLAGVVEEYVMRGFCLGTLTSMTRSMPVAVLLVTVSFGLAHGYQGWLSMLRATALGALLAVPVVRTHALGPSIVAHAGMDMLSGGWLYAIARAWGVAT